MLRFRRNTELFPGNRTEKRGIFQSFPIALYVLIRYNIGYKFAIRQLSVSALIPEALGITGS